MEPLMYILIILYQYLYKTPRCQGKRAGRGLWTMGPLITDGDDPSIRQLVTSLQVRRRGSSVHLLLKVQVNVARHCVGHRITGVHDHQYLMSGPINEGEDSMRGVVASKSGFAHSVSIINNRFHLTWAFHFKGTCFRQMLTCTSNQCQYQINTVSLPVKASGHV